MLRRAIRLFVPLLSCSALACVPTKSDGSTPAARPSAPAASTAPLASEGGAANSADAGAAVTQREAVPEGPAKWRTIPQAKNGFHVVLDGLCSNMWASRVGTDVVVYYGGANPMYATNRQGDASFIALRDAGLELMKHPVIASPTGVSGRSIDDFWVADSTGGRTSEGAILHRYANGAWKTFAKDQTNLRQWVDGGVIGTLGIAAANGDVWVEGSSTKPPASLHAGMMFPAFAAFPTGDVVVVGATDDGRGPVVARAWAPGKKVSQVSLAPHLAAGEHGWFHQVSPTESYLVSGALVLRWDGTGFRKLGTLRTKSPVQSIHRLGDDDLWALTDDGHVTRLSKAGVAAVATPEPIASLDGVELGAVWAVGTSGKLYAREGDAFVQKPLAPPTFSAQATSKAKHVVVAAKDDVLVIAKYWEKAPGWTEPELHTMLQRTKPVKETLRCNEPDPENNNVNIGHGFQSWPPMADATCATPFVVLARRSNARKVTDDWPRLTKALKGQAALVKDGALVEIVSGDRTFVGAKATDLAGAKKLVTIAAKADRLRPEIVCGDPDVKRTIPIVP